MSTNTADGPIAHTGKTRTVDLPRVDGSVEVSLVEDDDYLARLEVAKDGTTWRYGVDSDRRAEFIDAVDAHGAPVTADEPDWMWLVFNTIDVRDRRQ